MDSRTNERNKLRIEINRSINEAVDGLRPTTFPFEIPPDEDTTVLAQANNYIDNSDLDYSTDAYVNDPQLANDSAEECFNFYRQRFIQVPDVVLTALSTSATSASNPFKAAYTYPMPFFALGAATGETTLVGTLTRVNDGAATLSIQSEENIASGDTELWFGETVEQTDAKALKATGHSLFAANETANTKIPRWDKVVGQMEIGSDSDDNWDCACPLAINLATPGLPLFLSFLVKLRSGATLTAPIVMFGGIFDTTTGVMKFLEGGNFALTVVVNGAAGATSYECVVVGTFSTGEQVISDVITVANAKTTFDADNFLYWDWQNAPNVLDFSLYRRNTTTGDVVKVFDIYNGETAFFDKNVSGSNPETALPTIANQRARAFAITSPFTPTTSWVRVPLRIDIPATYDVTATTSFQVVRFGVLTTGNDSARPVALDRPMLSLQESVWGRSARDMTMIASEFPVTTVPDGTIGIGNCFHEDTPVFVWKDGSWTSVPIKDAEKGMYIANGDSNSGDRIIQNKRGKSREFYNTELKNGIYWKCTPSERFITSRADKDGTLISRLTRGDDILTGMDDQVRPSRIIKCDKIVLFEPDPVHTLSLQSGKIFLAGHRRLKWWQKLLKVLRIKAYNKPAGALAHNRKDDDYRLE